jgi:hypothetical protein
MNKFIYSIVLLILFNNSEIIGQTPSKIVPSISFCGASKDNDIIKFDDLLKCHELTLFNSDSKIVSYEVGFNESDMFKTIVVKGNAMSDNDVKFLYSRKGKEVNTFFISDIKLDSENNSDNLIKGLKLKLE